MVVDHVEQVKQLHLLVEEELQQLPYVLLGIHHDYSLLRFDHQYEDWFEKLIHWEESIDHNYSSSSFHPSLTLDTNTPRCSIPNGGHA